MQNLTKKWEETLYRIGCKIFQEIAQTVLDYTEEKLFQNRDKKWKVSVSMPVLANQYSTNPMLEC
ncbi:TPA: hypothetical protein ENS27_06790 [bacterium]|nr:hypothetical protein [bacterium]